MQILALLGHVCLNASQKRIACAGFVLLTVFGRPAMGAQEPASGKRRIAVRDTIEMTEFADRGYFLGGRPESPVAIFSPDGKQFIVRLKKGDVERNVIK